MKTIKNISDKASNYLDSKGLANPVEVINESLGGETREESKKRRESEKMQKQYDAQDKQEGYKNKTGGIPEMLQGLKKADSIKQDFVNRNINSTDFQTRSMAEDFKKQLDNDTSVMLETGSNKGRRINSKGEVYGPEMKKENSGLYTEEVNPINKAKGGIISSASKRIKSPTMSFMTYSKTGKPAGMKTMTVKKSIGGKVSSASNRADGCAIKGKTRA